MATSTGKSGFPLGPTRVARRTSRGWRLGLIKQQAATGLRDVLLDSFFAAAAGGPEEASATGEITLAASAAAASVAPAASAGSVGLSGAAAATAVALSAASGPITLTGFGAGVSVAAAAAAGSIALAGSAVASPSSGGAAAGGGGRSWFSSSPPPPRPPAKPRLLAVVRARARLSLRATVRLSPVARVPVLRAVVRLGAAARPRPVMPARRGAAGLRLGGRAAASLCDPVLTAALMSAGAGWWESDLL